MPLGPLAAGLLLGTRVEPRRRFSCFARVCVALAIWSTLSPSIRNAPSLSELDDLPAPVSA